MINFYLGIDQGTTGVAALLLDTHWKPVARGYCAIRQIYPQNGWVEHDAMEIWEAVRSAVSQSIHQAGILPCQILSVGVAHEGESVMLWDRVSGQPLYNTIVWQDRRTSDEAQALSELHGDLIRSRTGLHVDSYFSALKLRWLMEHVPEAKELLVQGRLLAGTMDAWLVWNMTRGAVHATDLSTASRTMLLNLQEENWDSEILDLLDLPAEILPRIQDSGMVYGYTDPEVFCGICAPIGGVMVDQQAALFGQGCITPGTVKTTYGTGCFMLMNTGETPVYSNDGIITTVGWRTGGKTTYALDGAVYIAGAALNWLRDGLKLFQSPSETDAMAQAAGSDHGLYFVPAFTGLAAPYWDSHARGMMIGITAATTREQIVRAALEAIAYQVSDVLHLMNACANEPISLMRCDGGVTSNQFLMQFQADILGIPVCVPENAEATALGAAFMGAIGSGTCTNFETLSKKHRVDCIFTPRMSADQRENLLNNWHKAVERSLHWAKISSC